jgi:hypothetical protein
MQKQSTQNAMLYGVAPAIISLVLIGMYFSGVHVLQSIVSPNWDLPNPDAPREFGLLENLQHVFLIAIAVIAALAAKRTSGLARLFFAGVTAMTVFVFLEEIDYGLHYYEIATGDSSFDPGQVRNVHNIGDANRYFKKVGDAVLILFFGLLPLVLRKNTHPVVRAVLPSAWCVLTLVVMLAMRSLAHGLRDYGVGDPGTIDKNISEFRELNVYYLGVLYVYDIAHRPFAMQRDAHNS